MKKCLFISVMIACNIVFATSQNVENCVNPPVSHWSFGLKAGANYFRALPASSVHVQRIHLILGGTVEYSINPLAGIGIELMNNPYSGKFNTTTLDASILDLLPYFSVNLSNLLSPYRSGFWKKVNIFSETGGGYGLYNYSLNNKPTKYDFTMLAKTGVNIEYNINKLLALGFEGQYRYYDRANLGGAASLAKGNCEAVTLSIGMRYKFGTKSKQHARNINMCEYDLRPTTTVIVEKTSNDSDQVAIAALTQKVQNLEDQLKLLALKKDMASPAKYLITSFQTIEFEFDSSNLTQSSFPALDMMAEILNNASWNNLKIYGNTDFTGSNAYNQKLSEKRANTVKSYLIEKAVPDSRITTIGNGEEKPVATNYTKEGRQKNRRVDFEITK